MSLTHGLILDPLSGEYCLRFNAQCQNNAMHKHSRHPKGPARMKTPFQDEVRGGGADQRKRC